jgi:hypothetical protein
VALPSFLLSEKGGQASVASHIQDCDGEGWTNREADVPADAPWQCIECQGDQERPMIDPAQSELLIQISYGCMACSVTT